MRDSDGGRAPSSLSDVISKLDAGGLRFGVPRSVAMSESRKRVIRHFLKRPGTTAKECAKALDLESAVNIIFDLAGMGYLRGDHRYVIHSKITVTDTGVRAYERVNSAGVHVHVYEPYVSPRAEHVRSGGEDALQIKSRGVKA